MLQASQRVQRDPETGASHVDRADASHSGKPVKTVSHPMSLSTLSLGRLPTCCVRYWLMTMLAMPAGTIPFWCF